MWEFFKDLKRWAQVGIVLGLLGGLAGAAMAIIYSPIFGTIFTVAVFGIIFLTFHLALGPYAKQKRLLRSGKQATGTILEVEDTGVTINEIYPLIKVRLEVQPPGGAPYQAETKMLVSRLEVPQIQPGLVVPVLYDPKDPSSVTIGVGEGRTEAGAMASTPSAGSGQGMAPIPFAGFGQAMASMASAGFGQAASPTPSAGFGLVNPNPAEMEKIRMAEEFLTKEDQRSQEILATGKPARARILNAMSLGINVNGNNPAMTFLLEVLPEGEPSFQGQATGVIAEASVPKYQVGREIFVKYDPADKSRISLDHS